MIPFVLALLATQEASADAEMYSYGVDEHTSCTGNDDLDYAIAQADAIWGVFYEWQEVGDWDTVRLFHDAQVDTEDFTNWTAVLTWGADETALYGADAADVAYLSSHGSHHCEYQSGEYWSRVALGDDDNSNDCRSYTDGSYDGSREMLWGDAGGDTDILILDACESSQHCVWEHGGYSEMDGAEFQILLGFHGTSFDSGAQVSALFNYAQEAYSTAIGDDWLDYRVVWRAAANEDQCPTAVVWGSSSAVRDDFFDHGGFHDRFSTGAHNGTTIYYFDGCDPNNGEVL